MQQFYSIRFITAFGRSMALGLVVAASGAVLAADLDAQQARERGTQARQYEPTQRIEGHVAKLTERLALSEQQQGQVRSILTQQHDQMQALRSQAGQAGQDRGAAREQMRSIHETTQQQISAVLTEQQRTTYQTLRQEMRGRHGGEGARGKRGQRTRSTA
jgi:periplasmic protein CpxP/Spy